MRYFRNFPGRAYRTLVDLRWRAPLFPGHLAVAGNAHPAVTKNTVRQIHVITSPTCITDAKIDDLCST